MAGAKINTKTKGKDDRNKGTKSMSSTNDECEDQDFSLLRKPVFTTVTGFAQARKIFDFATEELKGILANECDLLYECKVCRNIFRSLANFISHKRVYCKEKFNSSVHSHFMKKNTTANEMLRIKQMEDAYQESLKVTNLVANEDEDRIPLTKDLTGIMEKLTKIKGRYNFDEQQVTLQKIPNSSVAMFQSHCEENKLDNMLAQVQELDNIISRDNAVLQRDGSFNVQSSLNADKTEDADNVIQISDDDDSDEGGVPKCKICDMQFSTQKTLKFHMKYKHLESRLVFPCPDCLEIFSTSWSVYRHLFKVHRKSAAQIRRLRESIQAKAFRMNNPPAFYEKKKNSKPITPQKISEEERLDQENQAWMDNMEGDGELPRCGGCGRTFERRAALAAHTHTCQPRSRALARRPDAKRIEIQIRKDYNKGPTGNPLPKDAEIKQVNEDSQIVNKVPEKSVELINKASELAEKMDVVEKISDPIPNELAEIKVIQKKPDSNENILEEATMDILEDRSSDSVESPEKASVKPDVENKAKIRLPFAHQAEKSNLTAFKQRMRGDIDMEKLLCKKCDTKHTWVQKLYEHMADHYKWMRYACKLCNFKNYDFEKLPEHVKVVHKLKGDSDFYFSTVKALDGVEALELAEPVEESDVNEDSAESRRPSRCSSDSSRLSDDSSSSSTRVEGARKRKTYHNRAGGKKKKESNDQTDNTKESDPSTDRTNNIEDSESPSNAKASEDNSSDMDDIEEKITKQSIRNHITSVASRRPVRKKTKPKNEDFEYDLSNLLKMEAQGYRDSQTVTTPKPIPTKKKQQQEIQANYDNINKDHTGALAMLSKKAVDKAAAELKTTSFGPPIINIQKDQRISNIFARPLVPKVSRGDKVSPRKDTTEEAAKEGPSLNKIAKIQDALKEIAEKLENNKANAEETANNITKDVKPSISAASDRPNTENQSNSDSNESVKAKVKIPSVVPIKFRRQSLELMKNPIINKNISDFSKSGMKTKILLIKPINRNKDGVSVNTPLKFQTIKLKEPNKSATSNEENSNDQIVVVKVPKVERNIARNVPDTKKIVPVIKPESVVNDTDTNIASDEMACPMSISDNATNKTILNNDNVNSSSHNADQIDTNNSILTDSNSCKLTKPVLDHPEILETTNNIDKDGCGSHVSSNKSEPMGVQELPNVTSESIVQSENIKDITHSKTTSVQKSAVSQKPTTEQVGISESCTSPNDAISVKESINMDSATIPNHTPS